MAIFPHCPCAPSWNASPTACWSTIATKWIGGLGAAGADRAGLHLRKYLAKASGTALWSPEVLDMGAFLQRISGLQQGGSIELVFTLYEAHVQLNGERADPFAEFIEWAPVTLRDMSEVDAHLLDLGTLYRDLREYHELRSGASAWAN
ncbi:MAG: hypothetical protein R2818_11515 [Flavobacteriales bacterium]